MHLQGSEIDLEAQNITSVKCRRSAREAIDRVSETVIDRAMQIGGVIYTYIYRYIEKISRY